MKEIEKGMLSDVHLSMASNFLKFQFHDIKGLEAPLYVIAHEKIAESYTCVGEKFSDDCIQFMNTGRGHWVTCIIKRGNFFFLFVLYFFITYFPLFSH